MATTDIADLPFALKQQISAGGDFDGTLPTGTPTLSGSTFLYTEQAAGGKFDPVSLAKIKGHNGAPLKLVGVEIELGGQSAWSLSRVDADGDEVVAFSGTTQADYLVTEETDIVMLPTSHFVLSTTGASAAMKATLIFARYRG